MAPIETGTVVPTIESLPPMPGLPAGPDAAAALENAQLRDKQSWRERLGASAFSRALSSVFDRNPRLDDDLLDELETALLAADVGIAATTVLITDLRKRMAKREFADANALLKALREDLLAILKPVARPLDMYRHERPFVLMVVGVNGVGKTTTIGKLAQHLKREGADVMLAAGDTFRAAAVELL
jgi:fused signal recognition particle receptor